MYGLTLVTGPIAEPVTLAEVKLWARIDVAADDDLITALITAARRLLEQQYGRALLTQTWTLSLDEFPGGSGWYWSWLDGRPSRYQGTDYSRPVIYLPRPPCVSVTSVEYIDGGGTLQTLSSTLYQVDTTQEPARIAPAYGCVWPVTRCPQTQAVRVTYIAGYGDAPGDVPETIKTALKLTVASWYAQREDFSLVRLTELPMGAAALLASEWHGGYA